MRILRKPELQERYPRADSTIDLDVKNGVLTTPVALGKRCVGWPEHEADAIIAARISGATEDEVRELVRRLMAKRQALRKSVLSAAVVEAVAA